MEYVELRKNIVDHMEIYIPQKENIFLEAGAALIIAEGLATVFWDTFQKKK